MDKTNNAEKTFLGNRSKEFWDAVNSYPAEDAREIVYEYGCRAQELEVESKRLKEENILLKGGITSYESQIKKMRISLRNWCIVNGIKMNDEGPDILIDN